MPNNGIVLLDESLVLGKGRNKVVYIHPDNPERCIKINNEGTAFDHLYEMRYRKTRELLHLPPSSLLTKYYGTVKTNYGDGFVFERVCDYDGITSKTIGELINLEIESRKGRKSTKELLASEKKFRW
jgi:hypothetical protein